MAGKLNVYNLGAQGVNVDKNPVELEDGELTKAQNAIQEDGSLRKRRGLVKVNSVAAAGAIKGAKEVPIAVGTAGNESPTVDADTRTFLAARRITSTTSGWNTTTDNWSTSPTTGGPDGYDAAATPRVPDYLWTGIAIDTTHHKYRALWSGRPAVTFRNRLYYAGNDYTFQSTAPTVRMWDGSRDFLLSKIPNRGATPAEAIMEMIVGGDNKLYLSTFDSGQNGANTMLSRIFQVDPDTGQIRQIGENFPISPETVRIPFSLSWYLGKLWTRTQGGGITAVSHKVYSIRPLVDTNWALDATEAFESCNLMFTFQGQLYMGIVKDLGNAALIRVRSTLGAYSTSFTVGLGDAGGANLVSFGYSNGFGAAATFGGNLYVSYWNQRGIATDNTGDLYMRIYKFNGTSWTVVYGPAANDPDNVPYNHAIVAGGRLYFISAPARTSTNVHNRILYTSDGSSFTSVTTSVLDNDSGGFLASITSSS